MNVPTTGSCLQNRSKPTLPLALLCALCVVAVPLFVRMPLTNDAEQYDLQADVVRRGGVLYRDALEPNLPGVVWVHLGVRSLLGESSEALKAFDLVIFAGILALSARLLVLAGGSRTAAAWTVLGLAAFYLSQSEWIHCQRDVWLLLPALSAIVVRVEARHRGRELSAVQQFLFAALEGVLWGCGVWLKPYILIPAALVWVTSQWLARRPKKVIAEVSGLLCGGGVVGAAGIAWMLGTGCWPYFIETATHWNPEYFAAGRENWTLPRWIATAVRLFPWYGLLIVAGIAAARIVVKPGNAVSALLAAAFVGWFVQAFALQHLFDYIHAPAVLLAFLLLAVNTVTHRPRTLTLSPADEGEGTGSKDHLTSNWRIAWVAFAVVAICCSPLVRPSRLELWSACIRGNVTPGVRDRLSHFHNPNRQDLARVVDFLQRQGVSGTDVCFYNSDFVGMYRQMGLTPPTRYTYLYELIRYLPNHHDDLLHGLAETPHRFVVTDVVTTGIKAERVDRLGPNGPLDNAKAQPRHWSPGYPWSCPVVFRSGTYLVHRIDGPIESLSVPNMMLKPPSREAHEVVVTR